MHRLMIAADTVGIKGAQRADVFFGHR